MLLLLAAGELFLRPPLACAVETVLDRPLPSYFWRLFGLALVAVVLLCGLALLLHREHKATKAIARKLSDEVAQRRRAEEDLKVFRMAVEQSPASIVITSPEGTIEYVNPQFSVITGYSAGEAVGNNPRLIKAEGLSQEHYAEMWRMIKSGQTWRGEFVNRRKSGEIYWEAASISPVFDEQGQAVAHYLAVKEDITPRKRMEEELKRRSEVLQATLDYMLHGIVMVDATGKVVAHNKRLVELFDFPHGFFEQGPDFEDVVRHWGQTIGLDEKQIRLALKTAHRSTPYSFELSLPSGRTVEVLQNPLPDGGFVRTATDITSRKQAEALREDMDRISRHDLKSPLNGIIGLPQLLLEDENLTPEQRELLQQLREAGYRMLRSINLSLDLFKMETGRFELQPEPVDLVTLLRNVLREAGLPRERDGITARLLLDGREPAADERCVAWAEELLCYNMFSNLVTNAAEAAPKNSEVLISLQPKGREMLTVIHNQGAVPEAIRERFFEKYATQGKVKGTGLGTYSAKLIATVQHGSVKMRSSTESGTTLTVTLPAAEPDRRRVL